MRGIRTPGHYPGEASRGEARHAETRSSIRITRVGRLRSISGQCLATEVVNHVEDSEQEIIPERIGREVDRPAPVNRLTSNQGRWIARDALRPAPPAVLLHQVINVPNPLWVLGASHGGD